MKAVQRGILPWLTILIGLSIVVGLVSLHPLKPRAPLLTAIPIGAILGAVIAIVLNITHLRGNKARYHQMIVIVLSFVGGFIGALIELCVSRRT